MSQVDAVFFDADGVLQRPGVERRPRLCRAFGCADEALSSWERRLFDVEERALLGAADFAVGVRALLSDAGCPGTFEDVAHAWTEIEVDETVLACVASLRGSGIRCFVASNQERIRGTAMSRALRFRERFDGEFYSFALGVAKPDPRFFEQMLASSGVAAARALFVDDRADNVAAARGVGMRAECVELATTVAVVERAVASLPASSP